MNERELKKENETKRIKEREWKKEWKKKRKKKRKIKLKKIKKKFASLFPKFSKWLEKKTFTIICFFHLKFFFKNY